MSTPLPGSSPYPPAATNTPAPQLATTTPAFPPLLASSGSPLPPLATFPLSRSAISAEVVVVVVVVVVVGMVVVVVVSLLFMHCKKKGWRLCSAASSSNDLGCSVPRFAFGDVENLTDHFSEANLLGEGGFGPVYRGILPHTGKEVAVKRLRVGGGQGEREFLTEVKILSRVHHNHVVPLVGYCKTPSERILVYELVPNKTLAFHLHGQGRPTLDWPTRVKIALGSAKGLEYLHEDYFGLAKFTSDANSHVSTNVKGTIGYLDPEYISSGNPTEKSDVFSFGVVLLELITGRRAVDMDVSLVNLVRPQLTRYLEDGNFDSFVDPRLQNEYKHNEMTRMVACAAACVHYPVEHRPKMSKIVRALEGNLPLSDLNDGIRPGLSVHHHCRGSSDIGASEDLGNSQRMPLASQEYGRRHYSEPTSGSSRQTNLNLEMGRMKRDSRGFGGGS